MSLCEVFHEYVHQLGFEGERGLQHRGEPSDADKAEEDHEQEQLKRKPVSGSHGEKQRATRSVNFQERIPLTIETNAKKIWRQGSLRSILASPRASGTGGYSLGVPRHRLALRLKLGLRISCL